MNDNVQHGPSTSVPSPAMLLCDYSDIDIFREFTGRVMMATPDVSLEEIPTHGYIDRRTHVDLRLGGRRFDDHFSIAIDCGFDAEGKILYAANLP